MWWHWRSDLINHYEKWSPTYIPQKPEWSQWVFPASLPAGCAAHSTPHFIPNVKRDQESNHGLCRENLNFIPQANHKHDPQRQNAYSDMKIRKMLPPKATLNKWHNGKCDENLLESYSKPKHHHYQISGSNAKAASLSPLPLSVWLALVSDESLSWPYSPGSHVTLSHRSLPRGSHRKSVFPGHLNCPAVQRGKKGRVVKSRTLNLGALFFVTVIRLWAKLQYFTFLLLLTVADIVVAI